MTGKLKGFWAKIIEKLRALGLNENIVLMHCIKHRENLCAQVIKMDHVITVVITTVNFIRKQGLNHQSIQALLLETGNKIEDLPYHTAVRWLSKGKVFARFSKLSPWKLSL